MLTEKQRVLLEAQLNQTRFDPGWDQYKARDCIQSILRILLMNNETDKTTGGMET